MSHMISYRPDILAWQSKLLPASLPSHMGTASWPSCSTYNPTFCLKTGNAAESSPSRWAPVSKWKIWRKLLTKWETPKYMYFYIHTQTHTLCTHSQMLGSLWKCPWSTQAGMDRLTMGAMTLDHVSLMSGWNSTTKSFSSWVNRVCVTRCCSPQPEQRTDPKPSEKGLIDLNWFVNLYPWSFLFAFWLFVLIWSLY